MDDQKLLRDLARAALDEEEAERGRWERWDRLNDGELSAEEEAELRALASTSNEAERAYEAFRPFSPDFRARVAAAIGPLGAAKETPEPVPPPARAEEPRPILGGRSGRSRFLRWTTALGGSGLAAAAVLFLLLRSPAALPAYVLAQVRSGVEPTRSEGPEATIPALTAGARFFAGARPDDALSGRSRLGTQCFVIPSSDGRIRRLKKCDVTAQDARGSVKLTGTIDPDLPAGPATLLIVLGYPRHLPTTETVEKLAAAASTPTPSWVALRQPIEIRAP